MVFLIVLCFFRSRNRDENLPDVPGERLVYQWSCKQFINFKYITSKHCFGLKRVTVFIGILTKPIALVLFHLLIFENPYIFIKQIF